MNTYNLNKKSKIVIMEKIDLKEIRNNNKSYEENFVVIIWKEIESISIEIDYAY